MARTIGERIRHLRQARGFTLRHLAVLAQVPQSTLSCVETGVRDGQNLTLQTGGRLARALGVTLDALVGLYVEDG